MSSISHNQLKALRNFFRKHLLPLAGEPLVFEDGANQTTNEALTEEGSYYIRKHRPPLQPQELELAMFDKNEIRMTLENYWAGKSFARLAGPLVKLTSKFENQEEKDNVSSSVYEMF
jgi:hypothetical protein